MRLANNQFDLWLRSLTSEDFEHLICDILAGGETGLIVERYGRSGQKQFGVDIIAIDPARSSTTALECKRVRRVDLSVVKQATERFWHHRQRWISVGVRRFVLCFAANLDDTVVYDFLLELASRFRTVGISFEFWTATTIERKLARLPSVAASHGYKIPDTAVKEPPRDHEKKSARFTRLETALRRSHLGRIVRAASFNRRPEEAVYLREALLDAAASAGFRPGDQLTGLAVVRKLLEDRFFIEDWRLRRALGKSLGDLLIDCREGATENKVIAGIAEVCLESAPRSIVLAIGGTEALAAARRLGYAWLGQLLNRKHPQVRWQLAKKWSDLRLLLANSLPPKKVIEIEDPWVRRRFLLTLLQETKARASTYNYLHLEASTPRGERFVLAAVDWMRREMGTELIGFERRSHLEGTSDVISRVDELKGSSAQEISDFVRFLDYRCVALDYQLSRGEVEGGISTSEGRYGVIRSWVALAIDQVSPEHMLSLLGEMLCASDEGIRWAVAVSIEKWVFRSNDYARLSDVLATLLADEHAWVLRDAIGGLARYGPLVRGIDMVPLVREANRAVARAVADGWNSEELLPGLLNLLAIYPDLITQGFLYQTLVSPEKAVAG